MIKEGCQSGCCASVDGDSDISTDGPTEFRLDILECHHGEFVCSRNRCEICAGTECKIDSCTSIYIEEDGGFGGAIEDFYTNIQL